MTNNTYVFWRMDGTTWVKHAFATFDEAVQARICSMKNWYCDTIETWDSTCSMPM